MTRALSLSLGLALSASAFAAKPPAAAPTVTLTPAITLPPMSAAAPARPDRSRPPEVAVSPFLTLPEPQVHTLAPGLTAWFIPTPGARKVEIELTLLHGALELGNGTPDELGEATYWLQDVATSQLEPSAMADFEAQHEVDVSSSGSDHDATIHLTAPLEELGAGLNLLDQVLHTPTYPKSEVSRYVRDQLNWLTAEAPTQPGTIANQALSWSWYPASHPYGARPNLDRLKSLTSEQLATLQEAALKVPAIVVVSGDIAWSELEPKLKVALAGVGAEAPRSMGLAVPAHTEDRVLAVDVPGQKQVTIKMRLDAPAWKSADYVAFDAVSWALGGHFLSRLNSNLREEKGYTYGVRARFDAFDQYGNFTVSVDVKVENAAEAITEIRRELDRIAEGGSTAEEIDAMLRERVGMWNDTFRAADSTQATYTNLFDREETLDQWRARIQAIGELTPASTSVVAAKYVGPKAPRTWVLVGPKAEIEAELAALGLSASWITADEAILGTGGAR
jgi:zinc protease